MITAYVMSDKAKSDSKYGIGVLYERDGEEILRNAFSRADFEDMGVHGGYICGTIAALYDAQQIYEETGDTELTVVVYDEEIVALETGAEPSNDMEERLLEYLMETNDNLTVALEFPHCGQELQVKCALSLATEAMKNAA